MSLKYTKKADNINQFLQSRFNRTGTSPMYLIKNRNQLFHIEKVDHLFKLKYYSPTVTHGKTFVYDFCVL